MKKLALLFIVFFSVILSSCVSTMTITNDSGKVKGIPFYTPKAVVKQETKYLYNWDVISLIKEEKKDKITSTPILTKRILKGQDLSQLERSLESLNNSKNIKHDLENVINEIKKLNVASLQSKDIKTDNVIDNKWTRQTEVNYSTKYYINSKLPWFGSSTLSQKLAPDGTLSEATGTSDSQIDELLTSIVGLAAPISSVKVAKIENEVTPQVSEEMELLKSYNESNFKNLDKSVLPNMLSDLRKEIITYKLKIEEEGFIYTFTKIHEINDSNIADKPIVFDLYDGNYTRSNWSTKEKEETKEKEDEKPTINVSGNIQLPSDKSKDSEK